MKNPHLFLAVCFGIFTAPLFSLQANETPKEPVKQGGATPGAISAEQEKMMKAFEAAGKVTDHHKALDYLVGDWTTTTKWWQAPGTQPEESIGKARFEPALGGRFIQEQMDGTSMGKPFQGLAYLGYDNTKKKYVTLWMDNMSTSVFMMEGDSTNKGKTITSKGTFMCPVKNKEVTTRSVMKKVGKNEVRYEHYDMDDSGKEFRSLEVVYKR